MRVLLVRPRAQAEATARRLALRGHAVLVAPILAVEPIAFRLPREKPDALLVTSANAVPAAARHLDRWRDLPVFAVGRRTAEALTEAGFPNVIAGPGAGADLAKAVTGALPAGRRLLHLAGHDRKAEPRRSLKAAGYAVTVREAYAAVPIAALPDAIAEALRAGALDAALHYSARSAETLVRLAEGAGVAGELGRLVHLCLSADVAQALADLPVEAPEVAAGPTENALLAALDRAAARVAPSGARAAAPHDAIHNANPARQDGEPPKDSHTQMSDPGRSDPLRRAPPTIDLKANEVARTDPKAPAPTSGAPAPLGGAPSGPAAAEPDDATPSAIEPVATTGLGKEPFPKDGRAAPDTKAASGPGKPPTSATPTVKPATAPAPTAAAGAKPGAAKSEPAKPEPAKSGDAATAGKAAVQAGAAKPAAAAAPTAAAATKPAVTTTPEAGKTATGQPDAPKPVVAGDPKPSGATPIADKPAAAKPATSGIPTSGVAASGTSASSGPAASGPTASGPATSGAKAEPARAEPPRKAGALLAASLVGGIIGAALMAGIGYLWLKPGELSTRMAVLEQRVASLPAPPANMETRLSAIESGLRQATDTANAAKGAAEGAAKVVQEQAGRPAGSAPDPALRGQVAELRGQVADLSKRLDEVVANGTAALKDLSAKVDELQARLQDSLTPSVAALQGSVRTIGETVAALRTSSGTQDTRSMDQERRLAAISGDLAKLSPQAILAALRITVAGRLDDALRSGAPLRPAIAALRKLGTPASSLSPLEPYADAAPPSAAALAAQFRPLAEQMLAQPETTGQSIGERLRRVAEKVVTVKVVGDGSGQDLPGIVARIQAGLGRGDLAAAASDWDRLPEPAKALSAAWADRLKGRVGVDAAARRIAADALGALDTAMP